MATVLVVEDDKLSQKLIGKILGGGGHKIVLATNVKGAWETLRQHVLVDLIVLDNQLERGWGWEFLRELRQDFIYRDLSVIVYTGHTERSSILKYVELGVQAMLVKPYNGQTILAEVAKALKTDWTARLIESPAIACERLKIKEADYYGMLSAAATVLKNILKEIQTAVAARREDPQLQQHVQQLTNQGVMLGMPLLKPLAEGLVKAMASGNATVIASQLQSLESLYLLVHYRALASMGVGDMLAVNTSLQPEKVKEAKIVYAPPSTLLEAYCRTTAGAPIWTFGRYFTRLGASRTTDCTPADELVSRLQREAPLADFIEAVMFMANAHLHGPDDLLDAIKAVPNFSAVYLKIVRQLGVEIEEPDPEAAVSMAIHRLGLYKTTVLVALARVARSVRVKTPLDLRMLTEHTLSVGLLSYEFSRMLRMSDEHSIAAAGTAHDIGKWLFAIGEPALYAASLGLAHGEARGLAAAETEIFGATHEEAGRRLLESAGASPLLQDVAASHGQPDAGADPSRRSAIAVVHLANHLAWAAAADNPTHVSEIQTRFAAPNHPVWTVLTSAGTELPMDVPELMEAMIAVAKITAWTSSVLINAP